MIHAQGMQRQDRGDGHLAHGDQGELAVLDSPVLGSRKLLNVLGRRIPWEEDEEQRGRAGGLCHDLASIKRFLYANNQPC